MAEFFTGLGVLLSGAACCGIVGMLWDHSRKHVSHESKFSILKDRGFL